MIFSVLERGLAKTLLVLASTWIAGSTFAQSEIRDKQLKGVDVRGRKLQPLSQTAAQTQKMDSADFVRQGVADLGDALRRMSGTEVRDYGGAGGLKTVSVRGMGAAYTQVSYNGLPVTDSRSGTIDLSRYNNLTGIDKVELVVADAEQLLLPVRLLGVARLALYSEPADSSCLHQHYSVSQGSFGTVNPAAAFSVSPDGRWGMNGGANFFYGRNDYPFELKNGKYTTREHRANSRMQAWTANAGTWLKTNGGGLLQVDARYYNNHRRLPGQVVYYNPWNDEKMVEQNAFGQLQYVQPLRKNLKLMAAAKYDFSETRYKNPGNEYPGGAWVENYWQREAYATAGMEWRPCSCVQTAYAVDYAYNGLNSNQASGKNVWRNTLLQSISLRLLFQQVSLTLRGIGSLIWNGKKRAEVHSQNLQRLSPSLVLAWRPLSSDVLTLNAQYKEFYRVPTFSESYFYHYGTQDLRSEFTRQISVGVVAHVATRHRNVEGWATVNVFGGKVKNKITGVPINLFLWRMVNLGEVRTAGLEASLKAAWSPTSAQHFYLSATYTLQRVEDRTRKNEGSYGRQLVYVPLHSGSASAAWENPWVNVGVHLTAAGERWATLEHLDQTLLPSYVETGFSIYRTFQIKKVRLSAQAALNNAFNRQYEIIRRYPMPGRAYRLTLGIDF